MPSSSVLIVEDDLDLQAVIEGLLSDAGCTTRVAPDAVEANRAVMEMKPDLILLDWMLPGMNGLAWVKQLRRRNISSAIVLLTARASDEDKAQGLAADIDDYITKPFSNVELLARIRAVLRRRNGSGETKSVGELSLDKVRHSISCLGQELSLSRREFALLEFLMANNGKVYSREQLLHRVWGENCSSGFRTVDVHVLWLRRKLEQAGSKTRIDTVWGVGYKLVPCEAGAGSDDDGER